MIERTQRPRFPAASRREKIISPGCYQTSLAWPPQTAMPDESVSTSRSSRTHTAKVARASARVGSMVKSEVRPVIFNTL